MFIGYPGVFLASGLFLLDKHHLECAYAVVFLGALLSELDVHLRRRRLQPDPGTKYHGSRDLKGERTANRTVHSALIAPHSGAQISNKSESVTNHAVAGRFFNSLLGSGWGDQDDDEQEHCDEEDLDECGDEERKRNRRECRVS